MGWWYSDVPMADQGAMLGLVVILLLVLALVAAKE